MSATRLPPPLRCGPYFGRGSIAGTTVAGGTPVSRVVRLYDSRTGLLVRETRSDAAGAWGFYRLALDRDWTVTAHDHTGQRDGVIHDRVRAGVPT